MKKETIIVNGMEIQLEDYTIKPNTRKEVKLRIGEPVRIISQNHIAVLDGYYLGRGIIIDSFDPNVLSMPEIYMSNVLKTKGWKYIIPINLINTSSLSLLGKEPRYLNGYSEDDFVKENIQDLNTIEDCHLNDFEWFEKIKEIIVKILV